MITVFYDGKCGLCAKEIRYYQKIAPKECFNWIDITQNPDTLIPYNISYRAALKELHSLDHDQKIHIGIDSFILIWRYLPYFRILGLCVSLPIIKNIVKFLYGAFARWRFKRLSYCDILEKKDI